MKTKSRYIIVGVILLLSAVSFANVDGWFQAAQSGDISTLKAWIRAGHDINQETPEGETALLQATVGGQLEAVRLLTSVKGLRINSSTRSEALSSLMIASNLGFNEILKVLIDQGADLDQTDMRRQSALQHAAKAGNLIGAKLLLEAGAQTTETDIFGKSAIATAEATGNADIAALIRQEDHLRANPLMALRALGVEPTAEALMLYAKKNQVRTVRLLLAAGVNVNELNEKEVTALDYAKSLELSRMIQLLSTSGGLSNEYAGARIALGALWDVDPNRRQEAFLDTIKEKRNEDLELFLKAGISIGRSANERIQIHVAVSPLIIAIEADNAFALEKLLIAGSDSSFQRADCVVIEKGSRKLQEIFGEHGSIGKMVGDICLSGKEKLSGFSFADYLEEVEKKRTFNPRPFPVPRSPECYGYCGDQGSNLEDFIKTLKDQEVITGGMTPASLGDRVR